VDVDATVRKVEFRDPKKFGTENLNQDRGFKISRNQNREKKHIKTIKENGIIKSWDRYKN
jgi:hypothetical protein